MEYAVYIYNRVIHKGADKTPLEKLTGKITKWDILRRFGCVCTVFVPKEIRENDLTDRGLRGRLLGFGDDFDLEERPGYKILLEDGRIIYSNSVKFHDNLIMTRLRKPF
jgi:hypothetical protein